MGGIPKVLTNTLNYLSKSHELHVYCLKSEPIVDAYNLNRSSIVFYHREMTLCEKFRRSGADLLLNKTPLFSSYIGAKLFPLIRYSKKYRDDLLYYLDKERFDIVVYATGLHESLLLDTVRKSLKNRPRLVAWSHLSYELTFKNKYISTHLNNLVKSVFSQFDAIVVLSEHDKSNFLKHHGLHVTHIYNAVSFTPSYVGNKQENSFVYVGSLSYDKGIDVAVEAFAKFHKFNSNSSLHIYGDGPLRRYIQTLICKYNLHRVVHLYGNQLNIESVLAKYSIFLFPSRYEGFGIAQVEAMACGLPIIASNIPVNIELNRKSKAGLLFNSEDVESLYDAMIHMHGSNIAEFSRNGIEFAKSFSIEIIGEQWENLFKTLLSQDCLSKKYV